MKTKLIAIIMVFWCSICSAEDVKNIYEGEIFSSIEIAHDKPTPTLVTYPIESGMISTSGICCDEYDIWVTKNNKEVLRITSDGDFYVNGEKVTKDIKVYDGFVKFLKEFNCY